MSTNDTEGTRLEELLLAVLRSGTPLAEGLRTRLLALSIWLLAEFPDEPSGRQLMTALMTLRDHGNPEAPGELPVQPDDCVTDKPETASDPAASEDRDAEQGFVTDELEAGSAETPDIAQVGDPASELKEPDPARDTADRLQQLWVTLNDDPVAGRYCSVYGALEADTADDTVHELWRRLFLICLRLSGEQAAGTREQAESAVADYPDKEQLVRLVPSALPEDDVAELAELLELAPELAQKWPDLVGDAAWLTRLAWHDEGVQCAHEVIAQNQSTPIPFNKTRRERFTLHIGNQLTKLSRATADGPDSSPIVSIDEALRGVVPIPLPQPGSWWTDCLKRSELRLEPLALEDWVHVLPLEVSSDTWDRNFDTKDVVRIQATETAGNHEGNDRVWILRYPVKDPRTNQLKKGRYIAVR